MRLLYFLFLLTIGFRSYALDSGFSKVYYKSARIKADSIEYIVKEIVSTDKMVKFKLSICNHKSTNLIFNPDQVGVIFNNDTSYPKGSLAFVPANDTLQIVLRSNHPAPASKQFSIYVKGLSAFEKTNSSKYVFHTTDKNRESKEAPFEISHVNSSIVGNAWCGAVEVRYTGDKICVVNFKKILLTTDSINYFKSTMLSNDWIGEEMNSTEILKKNKVIWNKVFWYNLPRGYERKHVIDFKEAVFEGKISTPFGGQIIKIDWDPERTTSKTAPTEDW